MKIEIPEIVSIPFASVTVASNAEEFVILARDKFGLNNRVLAQISGVSIGTIQRWVRDGSGEIDAVTKLRQYLIELNTKPETPVLLSDATPLELYDQCSIIGLDKIFQAVLERERERTCRKVNSP